jgi:hypothetical protein
MNALQDRRVVAAVGGVAILLVAVLLALFMLRQHKPNSALAPTAGTSALQVDVGQQDAKVSQTKPLRCFVSGQFVGLFTVQDCAARNGVAAQALDVGLDPSTGEVAAATGSATPLQPLTTPIAASVDPASLPPTPKTPAAIALSTPAPSVSGGPASDCLRFAGEWRTVGGVMPLGQCVRTLFDGRCLRPGDALYGRWNGQTVRLLPGRVEISPDNRNFRTLVQQNTDDCSLPEG